MSREKRKSLIQAIEHKRQSKVITYITSDRGNLSCAIAHDIVSIIHHHILALAPEQRAKIDLFIYSRGGSSDVPWALVSMFREYCHKGSFSVLIPYRAHSAATVIALGADEIIMSKKAELGPIDATMASGPFNPTENGTSQRLPVSVEDVTGFFSLLERVGCARPEEKMRGFEQLTQKVHPLALGAVSRLLEETKLVGLRLLSTRAKPFTEEENHEIIRKLSSEVYSHSHAISRSEALKYLGLKQVKSAEDADVDQELWDLYAEYSELFDIESPFMPEEHLIQNDLHEHTWENLPVACIESDKRFDCSRISLKVRKLRNVPPNVSLTLNNIQFPQVVLPPLPPAIDQNAISAMVGKVVNATIESTLKQAAAIAAQEMLAKLPEKGFQKIGIKSGWQNETNA